MIDIEMLLKSNAAVDDYRLVTRHRTSYEAFFVHEQLETARATDTLTTEVTVYVKHDGKLGDSMFRLYESMDEQAASACIDAAVKRAGLVFNEPYELPSGGTECCDLPSNLTDWAPAALAARVADAMFAGCTDEKGSINATEIFLYNDTVHVKNSRGTDMTETKHSIMIEAIPTWNDGAESVELYETVKYMDFDADVITAELAQKMREVRDRQYAEKPATPMTCRVVLGPKETMHLLQDISDQLTYSNVYSHANLYKLGDDLQCGAAGDPLTITMAGAIPGVAESAAFDADGVRLGEKLLVDRGVVTGYHGSSRYAQYLGEREATGTMHCLKAAPGTLTAAELASASYLEIVSMSSMQVDLYNDYIGGEIRLAYWHDRGEVRPVTGISMTAGVKDILKTLRLSDQVKTQGAGQVPAYLMMQDVKVL